jgi:hypothetical protein
MDEAANKHGPLPRWIVAGHCSSMHPRDVCRIEERDLGVSCDD